MKVKELREFLKGVDDNVTIHTVNSMKNLPSVKHVHLATYKDETVEVPMLVFCSMGNHLPDTLDLLNGAS